MAKKIMLQGAMSNVGKSLLTAALCRIFKEDGYRAAPFKSQNMALNSYVTEDSLEIGRAQAMQAQAAGLEPSVLMNPILLKPTSDAGSQVILRGKPIGNMTASEYFRRKRDFFPEVISAFEELSSSADIVVIEGAGSPAELNLKSDDIVNMGLAKALNAPVLLIGDIDRGGVFAQLLGTLDLLEDDERTLVKGLIVNKFRGDRSIFSDGAEILEKRGKCPVAGVVPFIHCDIEDEDSLSDKLGRTEKRGLIDIAVIRLPRISNFTDLDVFGQYKSVSVRYVSQTSELFKFGEPDLIVIPGTKSTISDMKYLRESGLESEIKKAASRGVPIFGICGGYQMLGELISDPEGVDGGKAGAEIRGLGLLKTRTVFSNEKKLARTKGKFSGISGVFSALSGLEYEGYEIHMGVTESTEPPLLENSGGAFRDNVYGCYVHGIFDSGEVSAALVKALCERRGAEFTETCGSRRDYRERQFDILANEVRKSLDMELVYKILKSA